MKSEPVICRLDKADVIRETNACWDHFADQNNGIEFSGNKVSGKSIWRYIAGDTTKMWLSTLFSYARFRREPVIRAYRCDSPEIKRFMEMQILPEKDRHLCLKHQIIRTEAIDPAVYYQPAVTGKAMYFRCSICNKVQVQGQWYEGSEAAQKGLLPDSLSLRVAYRVCRPCRHQVSQYSGGP